MGAKFNTLVCGSCLPTSGLGFATLVHHVSTRADIGFIVSGADIEFMVSGADVEHTG